MQREPSCTVLQGENLDQLEMWQAWSFGETVEWETEQENHWHLQFSRATKGASYCGGEGKR